MPRRFALTVTVVATLLLAACSSDGDKEESSDKPSVFDVVRSKPCDVLSDENARSLGVSAPNNPTANVCSWSGNEHTLSVSAATIKPEQLPSGNSKLAGHTVHIDRSDTNSCTVYTPNKKNTVLTVRSQTSAGVTGVYSQKDACLLAEDATILILADA